jgi:hypothetical protein
VHEATRGERGRKANEPKKQQYDGNEVKHDVLLLMCVDRCHWRETDRFGRISLCVGAR